MNPRAAPWSADWVWGLVLIFLTVVIYASSLGLINRGVTFALNNLQRLRHVSSVSIFVVGGATLSVTIMHGIETLIWAGAYRLVGALPDNKAAVLYSLNAITSYGHERLSLASGWQLMGALEALNGWILFGLTTAFLFTVVEKTRAHTSDRQ